MLHYLDINQFSYRLLQLKNYSSCLTVFIRIMIHYVLSPVSYIVCVRTTAITGVITNWLIKCFVVFVVSWVVNSFFTKIVELKKRIFGCLLSRVIFVDNEYIIL